MLALWHFWFDHATAAPPSNTLSSLQAWGPAKVGAAPAAQVWSKFLNLLFAIFFPTCQVRVVRFYVSWLPPAASCRLLPPSAAFRLLRTSTAKCSLPDLNRENPRPVFPAGPQPRPSTPSVPCRTSTATIHAKCPLPDLNRDHPRPVFPAGPQPRPSTPSVPCRTSTARITPSVPCRTSTAGENAKRYAR